MQRPHLIIDIVADIVCPWCVVGYYQLQTALDQLADQLSYEISWQPFELNPDLGPEGENLDQHLQAKYGGDGQSLAEGRERLERLGQEVGFAFAFNEQSRIVNTFDAHRLLMLADTFDKQHELHLALFSAYFQQHMDISQASVLQAIAVQVGLNEQEVERILQGQDFAQEVRAQQAQNQKNQIQGVPTFVVNERYAITGAQPTEVLKQGLAELAQALARAQKPG